MSETKRWQKERKNQNKWKFYYSGSTVAMVNAYMARKSVYVARDCNESWTSETRQVFGQLLDLDRHKQLVVVRHLLCQIFILLGLNAQESRLHIYFDSMR